MAKTVLITLTLAGTDTGPFNLYSNIDGYATPFESSVAKIDLEAGYMSVLVPDDATTIRVASDNPLCDNYVNLTIVTTTTTSTSSTTTTTTSTSTSTTTTTTTVAPTTTTTTTSNEFDVAIYGKLEDSVLSGGVTIEYSLTNNGLDWATVGGGWADTVCTLRGTVSAIPTGSTLYIRVVAGVESPVQFGGDNLNLCPSSNTLCIDSFVVTTNSDYAVTVKVVANAVIGC